MKIRGALLTVCTLLCRWKKGISYYWESTR